MKERTIIKEHKDWKWGYIEYKMEGCDITFTCDKNEWRQYEIIRELTGKGADEDLLDELYSLGYTEGLNEQE